jgi:hypothetical protein
MVLKNLRDPLRIVRVGAGVEEIAVVWGSSPVLCWPYGLAIVTVAALVVMMWVWPCIGLFIVFLAVAGAAAVAWRRRRTHARPLTVVVLG